jgi:hypothetical protein
LGLLLERAGQAGRLLHIGIRRAAVTLFAARVKIARRIDRFAGRAAGKTGDAAKNRHNVRESSRRRIGQDRRKINRGAACSAIRSFRFSPAAPHC